MTIAAPPVGLLERGDDLRRLEDLLKAARAGRGALAMVEAPAGQGKTALLRSLREAARGSGMRVLGATGAELERDFSFGVVRQLLEPVLRSAAPELRDRLMGGAAGSALPVFEAIDDGAGYTADASYARLHGLFWAFANLSDVEPLAVVVDDAHWADAPSLRFLDVLARRLEDMPVLLAVAARPAEPGAEQGLLDGLLTAPRVEVLRPAPLSHDAVRQLTQAVLGGEPDEAFVIAAQETTGGNPLFVTEMLRACSHRGLAGTAEEAEDLRQGAPETVIRMVVARLRRLPPAGLAVARAISVLGDRSTPARIARLAELAREDVTVAIGELAASGVLENDRPAFVHPIVREAVRSGFAPEVGSWHRRAARLLTDERVRPDEVATHLLASPPEGEEWAAEALRAAGRGALAHGAPEVARRLLARALEETPAASPPPDLLLDLATAEARTGDPGAVAHLDAVLATADPVTAARAAQVRAHVLIIREFGAGAAEGLRVALQRADALSRELVEEIEDQYLDTLNYVPDLMGEYRDRLAEAEQVGRPSQLAHLAYNRAVEGAARDEVLALARRALADGSLIEALAAERFSGFYAIAALHAVEAADDALAALRAAEATAVRSGSPVMRASLGWVRPDWHRLFGDLRRAEDIGRESVALLEEAGGQAGLVVARLYLAMALLERGDLDEPERLLASLPGEDPNLALVGLYSARARLHAERGAWDETLVWLGHQQAFEARRGWSTTFHQHAAWLRVRALVGLGRVDEARRIADADVAFNRRRGLAGAEARARRGRALCLDADSALAELSAAVDAARRSPCPLVLAGALGELGSALRRSGRRVEAREPLREARDLAHRCGASGLERRVHDELVVAGARPQRVALSGVDGLTAAERRVADLAAAGSTNREIAEALFVTVKTVEVHLGRAYGKLGIGGRSQLAQALAAG